MDDAGGHEMIVLSTSISGNQLFKKRDALDAIIKESKIFLTQTTLSFFHLYYPFCVYFKRNF